MSYDHAIKALQTLADVSESFDYENARLYASLIKDFLRRAERYCEVYGLPKYTPFMNISYAGDVLPQDLLDGVLSIAQKHRWSPACTTACREYVKYEFSKDSLTESQREIANVYEPLFTLLIKGGDFYEHHGDICIRDAGMVLLPRK